MGRLRATCNSIRRFKSDLLTLKMVFRAFDNTDREAVGIQHWDDQSTLQMQDERICIR